MKHAWILYHIGNLSCMCVTLPPQQMHIPFILTTLIEVLTPRHNILTMLFDLFSSNARSFSFPQCSTLRPQARFLLRQALLPLPYITLYLYLMWWTLALNHKITLIRFQCFILEISLSAVLLSNIISHIIKTLLYVLFCCVFLCIQQSKHLYSNEPANRAVLLYIFITSG